MLGFDPISQHPISDIAPLERITGTIYVIDSDDTATITGAIAVVGSISVTDGEDTAFISGSERSDGYILATDGTDTATLTGATVISGVLSATDGTDTANLVGASSIIGTIDVTDQNDTANITGNVVPIPDNIDTHDGFTKDEIKRWKKLQKKLAIAEAKRIQARLDKRMQRKAAIKAEVSPEPIDQVNQAKVESVKVIKPVIDIEKVNAEIARLEAKQQELLQAVAVRQELARLQTELAIYEAKVRAEELDDEESILLLM